MDAAQLKAETVAALKTLPQMERDAITLIYCIGLVESEAAQLLGLTRFRFLALFHSARKKLKCQWVPQPSISDANEDEILAAVERLPELERKAIIARRYDGLNQRDAAKRLGVSRNKLRMAYNSGIYRLKTTFAQCA